MANYRINTARLKSAESVVKEEKAKCQTAQNNLTSSLNGNNVAQKMSTNLSSLMTTIDNGYTSIVKWMDSYITNTESLENYFSGKSGLGLIQESTISVAASKFNFDQKITINPYGVFSTIADYLLRDSMLNSSNLMKNLTRDNFINMGQQYYQMLRANSPFTEDELNLLMTGQATYADLMNKIMQDPVRRSQFYEKNYLQQLGLNFNSLSEYNDYIDSLKSNIDELEKEYNNTQTGVSLIITILINQMRSGRSYKSNSPLMWQYTDKNGKTNYVTYQTVITADAKNIKQLTFNDLDSLYADNNLYQDFKAAFYVERKTLFGSSSSYIWTNNSTQQKFLQNLEEVRAQEQIKAAELEEKLNSLRKEYYSSISARDQIQYQINNIDKYTSCDDFMIKNGQTAASMQAVDILITNFINSSQVDDVSGERYITISLKNKEALGTMIFAYLNNNEKVRSDGDFFYVNGIKVESFDFTSINSVKWKNFMTAEELQVYNYIYNTQGGEAAYNWLNDISDNLDSRYIEYKQKQDSQWAVDNQWLASVASVFKSPIEGIAAFANSLKAYVTGQDIQRSNVYMSSDVWRGAVGNDILANHGKVWAFVYNTGMSMADSVLLIGTNLATGGTMSSVLSVGMMGSRVYGTSLNDALDRGLSDGQAIIYALGSAAAESVMEEKSLSHLLNLGSASEEFGKKLSTYLATKTNSVTQNKALTAIGTMLYSATSQAFMEADEEFCTEIVDFVLDQCVSGDLSAYNLSIQNYLQQGYNQADALLLANQEFASQLVQSWIGGFASGFCFGGLEGSFKGYNYSRYAISHDMALEIVEKANQANVQNNQRIDWQNIDIVDLYYKAHPGQAMVLVSEASEVDAIDLNKNNTSNVAERLELANYLLEQGIKPRIEIESVAELDTIKANKSKIDQETRFYIPSLNRTYNLEQLMNLDLNTGQTESNRQANNQQPSNSDINSGYNSTLQDNIAMANIRAESGMFTGININSISEITSDIIKEISDPTLVYFVLGNETIYVANNIDQVRNINDNQAKFLNPQDMQLYTASQMIDILNGNEILEQTSSVQNNENNSEVKLKSLKEQIKEANMSGDYVAIKIPDVTVLNNNALFEIEDCTYTYFCFTNQNGETYNVFAPNTYEYLVSLKDEISKPLKAEKIWEANKYKVDSEHTLFYDFVTQQVYNFEQMESLMLKYNNQAFSIFEETLNKIRTNSTDQVLINFAEKFINIEELTPSWSIIYDALGGSFVNRNDNIVHLDFNTFSNTKRVETFLHEVSHSIHNAVNSARVPKNYTVMLAKAIDHIKNNSDLLQKFGNKSIKFRKRLKRLAEIKFNQENAIKIKEKIFSEDHRNKVKSILGVDSVYSESEINDLLNQEYEQIRKKITFEIYDDYMRNREASFTIINGILADILGIGDHGSLTYIDEEGQFIELSESLIYSHDENYVKRKLFIESSFHELMAEYGSGLLLDAQTGTNEFSKMFIDIFGQDFYDFINGFYHETLSCLTNRTEHNFESLTTDESIILGIYLKSFGNVMNTNIPNVNDIKSVTLNYNNVKINDGNYDIIDLANKVMDLSTKIETVVDGRNMTDEQINELFNKLIKKSSYSDLNLNNIKILLSNGEYYTFNNIVLNENNCRMDDYFDTKNKLIKLTKNSLVTIDLSKLNDLEIENFLRKIILSYNGNEINYDNIKILTNDGTYKSFIINLNQNSVDLYYSKKNYNFYDLIDKLKKITGLTDVIVDYTIFDFEALTVFKNKILNEPDINLNNLKIKIKANDIEYTIDYATLEKYLNSNGDITVLTNANENVI